MNGTPVICIDSSYLGWQALRALGNMENDDVPTGVLYNFLSRVLSIGTLYGTSDFVFAFDAPTKTGVRRKAYPGYKLKREQEREADPDKLERRNALYRQLDVLRTDILPALGFPNVFLMDGFEADDIIAATVGIDVGEAGECRGKPLVSCKGFPLSSGWEEDQRFVIVSADEDLWQLLGRAGRVSVYNPTTKVEYGYAEFCSQWGIVPVQWSIVKALAGCDSDNIDGVDGVGNKTAVKYLKGELPLGSPKLNAIKDFNAQYVRNWQLTRLPHAKFPANGIQLLAPNFAGRAKAFKAMCEKYAFATFLREPMFSQWRAFFKGEIVKGKEPGGKVPLGRVTLTKRHVSTDVSTKKTALGHKAPVDGGGFGF